MPKTSIHVSVYLLIYKILNIVVSFLTLQYLCCHYQVVYIHTGWNCKYTTSHTQKYLLIYKILVLKFCFAYIKMLAVVAFISYIISKVGYFVVEIICQRDVITSGNESLGSICGYLFPAINSALQILLISSYFRTGILWICSQLGAVY